MGRNTSLTEEIAQKLEFYWQLGGGTLADQEICARIGISLGQLQGWLHRNVKPRKPDGTLGKEGLRNIRARATSGTKTGYLSKLIEIAREAQAAQQFKVATQTYMWLLEKQFPKDYGNQAQSSQSDNQAGVLRTNGPKPEGDWQEDAKKCGQG